MDVSYAVWVATLVGLALVLAVDLLVVARRPHGPSMRESGLWVTGYSCLAVAFGALIWLGYGADAGGKFISGWLTEYSLSVDNLFVFMVIMTQFAVPRPFQQKALMVGIVLALLMRGLFIGVGAAALAHFEWLFYLFGLFLIYTAYRLIRPAEAAHEFRDRPVIRAAQRVLPVSTEYDGARLITRHTGRRQVTPMLLVMVALGTTDLVFALDSIPAIFGLTKAAYLVFTVNVFALLGLRQLYFLLGGLLSRLVHLSRGLAVVLGFIGLKLFLDALADNDLPFINGGQSVEAVPKIPTLVSLLVIVGILAIATITSLSASRREPQRSVR